MEKNLCGCIKCNAGAPSADDAGFSNNMLNLIVRFACELCGNKRCPHHSDHEISCTNSNEPGQPGSVYK